MDNYQGDLTDIVRGTSLSDNTTNNSQDINWDLQQFCSSSDNNTSSVFGDPFGHMRDPLLHELNITTYNYNNNNAISSSSDVKSNSNNNLFSRIQISSSSSKVPISSDDSPIGSEMINVKAGPPTTCLIDNTAPLQISSPRNMGIKRRKSQAKKVVCIPAPAAANSRSSGEVVPSDLWAWRKYGQKPIKGSPYPRGYYRCSSSKGCSARKQVERSRTDPNMLVITYTSEHNHPWPTQRNALAGSTRSQPSKTTSKNNNSSSSQVQTSDHQQSDTIAPQPPVVVVGGGGNSSIKEEFEIEEHGLEVGFSMSSSHIYKPSLPDEMNTGSNQSDQDFFAELGEIETDLLFSQGFGSDQKESKGLDPFNLFDWSTTGDTFGEEARRGL